MVIPTALPRKQCSVSDMARRNATARRVLEEANAVSYTYFILDKFLATLDARSTAKIISG